jgi:hypothetical protein
VPKLTRHQILLHPGDYAAIQAANPEHGAALIVRALVRKYVQDKIEPTKLDLPEDMTIIIEDDPE